MLWKNKFAFTAGVGASVCECISQLARRRTSMSSCRTKFLLFAEAFTALPTYIRLQSRGFGDIDLFKTH